MVNWKSPEEAEAWWERLTDLGESVAKLEKRVVDVARITYKSLMVTFVVSAGKKYIKDRARHYEELLDKSNNETEMSRLFNEFLEEYCTYGKSH